MQKSEGRPVDEKLQYEEMMERLKPRYYDKEGKGISLMEWADLCEDPSYGMIKKDCFGSYRVSTVWIGHNMNIFQEPKQIFETMLFCSDNPEEDCSICERYATLKEAELGHEIIAKIIEAKVNAKT